MCAIFIGVCNRRNNCGEENLRDGNCLKVRGSGEDINQGER
jgi:hypothetical protein